MEAAIEAGADDVVKQEDGSFVVNTPHESLSEVADKIKAMGFAAENAEITMLPSLNVNLEFDDALQFMKMVEMLEDLDDVQEVYSNAYISEDVGKRLT